MRKITQLLLTAALLVASVGGAKARTNVDMSTATASTNATWNSETNTFTWTAENDYIVIPGLSGDLTGCYLDFTISAACHLDIVYTDDSKTEGGWNGYGRFGSAGSKTQDLGYMAGAKINSVKEVRICSQSASGSLTVTSVSYYFPLKLNFDASGVATVPFNSIITSGGVTFDKSSGFVTNTDGSGYLAIELPSTGIDLSAIKRIDVEFTGSEDIWGDTSNRILANLEIPGVNTWQGSRYSCDYTSYSASSSNVTTIKWNAGGKTGESLTISSIKFTSEFVSCAKTGETVLNTLPWNKIDGSGTETPAWNMNNTSDTYYGNYSGDATHYADLTEFSELRVYCNSNSDGFRAFFIKADGSGTDTKATSDAEWKATEKYYSLDLSTVTKWNDKVALKSIKSDPWSGTTGENVTNIVVYKTPAEGTAQYLLNGKGLLDAATTTLLADATVTSIDVMGMTNVTAATLTSANPNCLFIANSGKLSNTNNVIVSGACASVALSDGYPFKAPANFTATSVSYDREMTVNQTTTVCLPFALTTEEAAAMGKFYTLTRLDGGTLTFTRDEDEISANTPYLFVPSTTAFDSYSSKLIEATPASLSVLATGCTFIGTMERTFLKSDASNTLYAYNDGAFVQIGNTNGAYLPAFRAYISVPGAGVKSFNIQFEDVDAIDSVQASASKGQNEIFNLAGQRLSKLQKGVNIVNGKKYIIK